MCAERRVPALRLERLGWTAPDGRRHELDCSLGAGDIAWLACADGGRLLQLFEDDAAECSGQVLLAGLPLAYWPPSERARRLRVLRPVARRLVGLEPADVPLARVAPLLAAPAASAEPALAQLALALADCPAGLDCLVVEGLLDALPADAARAALGMLHAFAQARGAGVLLLGGAPGPVSLH